MPSYEPPIPLYQDSMDDDSRVFQAPFHWALNPVEPLRQTNIRSKRPQPVPSTIDNNLDLNVLNASHGEPVNTVDDHYLSFDQFDQSSFVEQGMWQERPNGGVEEQVGVTEEDWHRLWGQRAYRR